MTGFLSHQPLAAPRKAPRFAAQAPWQCPASRHPGQVARRAGANLISGYADATLYWNNSVTRLWREQRCRSRFSEPAMWARH